MIPPIRFRVGKVYRVEVTELISNRLIGTLRDRDIKYISI